ncbi:unnamed protein product [Prorocentrum cordatum]|uniref:Uncharacterized protein n=1 Tax=Prorocentrum cordatum TaxID=2364126 RepID=A0ABN9VJJ1_9DINO|nr:unnamed protein product [Polarella glacialis]
MYLPSSLCQSIEDKHRFMTLRDDIVFFIFLYQLWIYKVDPNRPDEFGFVYVQEPVRRTLELTFVDVSLSLDDVEAFRRELDLAWLEAGVGEETVRGLATQVLAGEAAEPKASVAAVVQVGGPADSIGELCNLLDNGRVEIRGVRPRWTEQENAAGPGGPTGGKTGPLAPVPSAEGPAELAPSPAGAPAGAPAPAR